jgi:hypothetical protein
MKAGMVSHNFVRSLLYLIMVRSGHDEAPKRIRFKSAFLIFRWQKKRRKTPEKKKFLNSTYINVGCRSLGICSKAFTECSPMRSSILQNIVKVLFLISGAIHSLCTI